MKQELELQWETCCQEMQLLMEQLPAMEKTEFQYNRLLLAQQISEADTKLRQLIAEQKHMQTQAEKYRKEGNQGLSLYIQNQIGYQSGPIREQTALVNDLLKKGDFPDADSARNTISASEPAECLKKKIQDFREEYARVFAQCQELDRQLSACESE